jgi:DNA-binding transcriptional regulator YhcF (GntR family)
LKSRVGIDGVLSDIYNVRLMTKGLPESFFLLDQHRERFFLDVVDPMIAEARAIGVSLKEVVAHIERAEDTT